jgi:hypothetical protein
MKDPMLKAKAAIREVANNPSATRQQRKDDLRSLADELSCTLFSMMYDDGELPVLGEKNDRHK